MKDAAKEEAEHAKSVNSADSNGILLVSVVAESCWSKRTIQAIVAKFMRDKRINFALSKSYQPKCAAEVVSFNTKRPHYELHKHMYGNSPSKYIKQLEMQRLRKNQLRKKQLRNGTKNIIANSKSDGDYGESFADALSRIEINTKETIDTETNLDVLSMVPNINDEPSIAEQDEISSVNEDFDEQSGNIQHKCVENSVFTMPISDKPENHFNNRIILKLGDQYNVKYPRPFGKHYYEVTIRQGNELETINKLLRYRGSKNFI
ncbi:hypothetical protein ILUMI_19758, partial [Ignelater luminosus]